MDLDRCRGSRCSRSPVRSENQAVEVTAEAITVESVRHTWLRFYGAKVVEVTGWHLDGRGRREALRRG
jgi:hypothetical protein